MSIHTIRSHQAASHLLPNGNPQACSRPQGHWRRTSAQQGENSEESATQFIIYSTCRADFWEILLRCWLSKAAVENSQKSAIQSWIYTVHWVSSWLSEILRRCLLLKRLSMANRWPSRRRARRRLPRRRFFFFLFLFLFASPLQKSLKKRPAHFLWKVFNKLHWYIR